MTGNRIDSTFNRLAADGGKALMPYLTAGYPNLDVTAELLVKFPRAGASVIELGIPYSDSIADGPVIQESFSRVLGGGLRVRDIFKTVARVRQDVSAPILSMVSFSIVHRIGTEAYIEQAVEAGFDGLIVPDLSLEEAPRIAELTASAGIHLVMLVTPTSSADRFERIARISQGFVYYVSVAGTTGERDRLPPELPDNVRRLRDIGDKPVCVGFGIGKPEHVAEVCRVADGAIVGSAIVRRLTSAIDQDASDDEIIRQATDFVSHLATGLG